MRPVDRKGYTLTRGVEQPFARLLLTLGLLLAWVALLMPLPAKALTLTSAVKDLTCAGARPSAPNLGCNAGEFTVTPSFSAEPGTPPFCTAGSDFNFKVDINLQGTNTDRYDIGFFAGQQGNDPRAITPGNICSVATFPSTPTPWENNDGDTCGDFNGNGIDDIRVNEIKVVCSGTATGALAIPFLLTYRQNTGTVCSGPSDVNSDSGSKCNSGTAAVDGVVAVSAGGYVDITKQTLPDGHAQSFSFTATGPVGSKVSALTGATLTPTSASGGTYNPATISAATNSTTFSLTDNSTARVYIDVLSTSRTLTIVESSTTGWDTTASISCSNVRGTPTITTTGSTRTITVSLSQSNSAAACTITNTRPPTLQITKVSTGNVNTFNFTGTGGSGWTSQNITTVTAGVGVAGTRQTLTPSFATTITEAAVAGYRMSAVSCSGMGAGGTVTPNLASRTFAFDAAAMAPGSDISCTVTNPFQRTLTVTKNLTAAGSTGQQFAMDANGTAGTAGGNGASSSVAVDVGSIATFGEAAGNGATALVNYTSSYSCNTAPVTSGSGQSGSFTMPNANVACTVTNTRKTATLTLSTAWVNGITGNTATTTSSSFTNAATSGVSASTGNNTTTGSAVTVYAGESGTIASSFSVGSSANYTSTLSCTGNGTALAGSTLTVNPADTAIACTITHTRKSATLTLRKVWVNGATGDTATVSSASFTNNASSGASVSSGNNTTTGSSVTVYAAESGTLLENFSVGSAANYTASLACTGNSTALAGNTLTVNPADTAIVCTYTNTRKSATLTLRKTWVNGATGDTATVSSASFTNNASSGASVSSGNNTTTGLSVTVYAGESGALSESFSVGSAVNYTASLACTGNATALAGSTLTVNPADTAIVCTYTNTRKSATLTLRKTWVNGITGNSATVTSASFLNNATSGASISSGNNTTTGSSVTVYAGESGTLSESFSVGSAANYTASLACTGNSTALAGSSLTVNPADTAIVCTYTNTRKSATLTLRKTWVNGATGDTATVSSASFTNNASSGASVSSGNNTTTGSSVTVYAGESGALSESFSVGNAANYTAGLACTGNTTALAGSTLTVNPADTAIVCTYTNTRKSATLTLRKTWATGITGDTATVTSASFTNNASSGASVSSGNNTTTGSSVTVYAGESGALSESFSVGSSANYTASLSCSGNTTALVGSTLTVNPADTAIVCTYTNTRKSATLTLRKSWVNGSTGDTATVSSASFTNNASSGASVSSGNNTTTGSSVTVYAGESGTLSESFSVGSAANYTASLACTGNSTALAGSTLTVNPADTAIVCTYTNTRKSATLTLRKTWVNGATGDTATVSSASFSNAASSGASVSSGNNTTTGSSVTVYAGESGALSESFSVGSAANYTASLSCSGNTTALAGSTLTVNPADTAIVCTYTNTRKSATLTLRKTWVNGATGDTATVSSASFTNNASSGASVSSGNNTTTGSSVTVYAGESGALSESFSVGSAANYTASLSCSGNATALAGSTLTVNPADTAIVCTYSNTRKSATLTLRKTWVNAITGDTATVTIASFSNAASSGASVSSGNNTTTGSSVTVYAGESGALSESFSVGSSANYTASLACTGNATALAGSTLTVNPADTAIVCTYTNTRKSATLTLRKTWATGITGDTATVTSASFTNNASSGASVSSGNNTTTGSSVTVYAGESGALSESFSVGSAANYTASLSCSGNSTALAGSTLTINPADTVIVCTYTNTRKSATLTLRKTWVNGATGDTATVTTASFTNNASSGASVSSGGNTTTGSSVTVYAGESGAISESFSVGSSANYTASLACTGNTTALAGSTLTVNAADTAIVCTYTNTRKSAQLRVQKTWVNAISGNTATVTTSSFSSNATSGASTSTGNNTTTGAFVTVYAGESGTIAESFSVGSAANYTASLACSGNSTALAGSTLTINPADTTIACTFTNTRKSATLTLRKTWVNGATGDTATVSSASFTNNASSGASVSSGNNTTTGSSVTVYAAESGAISESFSVGSAANYTAALACTGNSTALAGSTLTVSSADTAIVCTYTNTRKSATLTLRKTWVNGITGNTATVTSASFTNNASSGASVSSGNNTTTGSSSTVYAGESGALSESFSVGSSANYTASLACSGNGTSLAGSTLTVNPADTAIICTYTNNRKSATLTLRKTWSAAIPGDTATVTSSGFANNATSGSAVASGYNTVTGTPVTVYAAESGTISETFSVGDSSMYSASLSCSGSSGLSGNTLTVSPADTAIVCTYTNNRGQPQLALLKWSTLISDPVNNLVNPKAVPGSIRDYSLRLTNSGAGVVDNNSVVISDPLPATMELYVNDLAGPGMGPVRFVDGTTPSGLTWVFTSLASQTDSIDFSNDYGATWTYVPTPDINGFDAAVTTIRLRPQGAMNAAGGGNPFAELSFRMRLK